MKLVLLATIVGFAQLCSSASIATTESTVGVPSNSVNTKLKLFYDKLKTIPGANVQWIDEFYNNRQQLDLDKPYRVALEGLARHASLIHHIDFSKLNETLFEHAEDFYGCGVGLSTKDQTLKECFKMFLEKNGAERDGEKRSSLFRDDMEKLTSVLSSKGVGTSETEKIVNYAYMTYGPNATTETAVDTNIIILHGGSGLSKRVICDTMNTEVLGIEKLDCTRYGNEEVKPIADNAIKE